MAKKTGWYHGFQLETRPCIMSPRDTVRGRVFRFLIYKLIIKLNKRMEDTKQQKEETTQKSSGALRRRDRLKILER